MPTMEEIEKIERLVRAIHQPYETSYDPWKLEKFFDDKVIYYIKLGVSIEELEQRAKRVEEERNNFCKRKLC
jgi:hypothetical protein